MTATATEDHCGRSPVRVGQGQRSETPSPPAALPPLPGGWPGGWERGARGGEGSSRRLIVTLCLLLTLAAVPAAADPVDLLPLVPPRLEHLEDAVASQLRETQELLASIQAEPGASPASLADVFGQSGRLYHAYELLDAAAVCYANAARLTPEDFRWTYSLAVLDDQAGRLEKAISGYRRALELSPSSLPAMVRLGHAYLGARRLDEARAALERALELEPGNAAALAGLGQVELSEKRYDAAVERLEAGLAAAPAADRLHHPLGLAYRGLGDIDKARHHLGRRGKVGVKPADPLIDGLVELKTGERVFLLRGQMAFRAGRYDQAVTAFRAALAALPDSVRARVNLGSALAQAGDREAAVAIYREALELDPDNATARFNLGVLLAQAGDAAGAAKELATAVEAEPGDVEARLELARTLRRQGRREEALDHATRVVELDPAREDARLLAAQILVAQGRFGEARQRLEAAHAVMPEAGRIAAALAKLLAAGPDLGERDGARALDLAFAVFRATRDPRHAETVAMALAEVGRCDEAADWQQRAVDAAREAGAEALAGSLAQTLRVLEGRPCRMPGGPGGSVAD